MCFVQDECVMRDPWLLFLFERSVLDVVMLVCWTFTHRLLERRMSSESSSCSSSSLVSSSFLAVSLSRIRWLVVVIVVLALGVVGRAGGVSLLLVNALSVASHFKLSSAVVSQVLSLVRSVKSRC